MRLCLSAFLSLCLACALAACKSRTEQSANGEANANTEKIVTPQEQTEAQQLLKQGQELYNDDRDEEAIEAYKKSIGLDPNNGEAYFRLGLAYMATGKKEEAEESFKKCVEVYEKHLRTNQKDAQAYYIMGQALTRIGNYQDDRAKAPKVYQEAVAAFKKAIALEPENAADMYYELGVAYNRLFQYQEAVKAFEKATELDPDNYRASDALEKAKEDLDRFNSIYRGEKAKAQQEEARRRQEEEEENANANKNANTNPNTNAKPKATPPAPKTN